MGRLYIGMDEHAVSEPLVHRLSFTWIDKNSRFAVHCLTAAQGRHKASNSHASDYRTSSSMISLLLTTMMMDAILSPASSTTKPSKPTSTWKATN